MKLVLYLRKTIDALIYLLKQQSRHQMRFHAFLFGDIELQGKTC